MRFEFLQAILPRIDDIALRYFRDSDLQSENKDLENFDPVTLADREIERVFRDAVMESFPKDGILGEELDSIDIIGEYQWIIDPIDGTRAYIIGAPSFTTLIALNKGANCELSVISQAFTGERFFANNGEAVWVRGDEKKTIATSDVQDLVQAKLASTFPEIGSLEERKKFEQVSERVKLTRFGLDGYAYALLAMGQIDLVIEAGLHIYDYAAPQYLVECAGGVVCDWQGNAPKGITTILAAANEELAEAALRYLNT